MKLDTDVIGDEKVLLHFEEVQKRALDARPATRRVKELMIGSDKRAFESGGSSLGEPWAPLAQSTLERKSREGIDPRPLHGKTGALESSLIGGRGKRTGATKSGARAGTSVWYSVFARGTKSGEPARKLVGLTAGERDEVLKIVSYYIVHGRVL